MVSTEFKARTPAIHSDANILNKYNFMEELGSGTFGIIYRAKEIKTNKIFAVKIINVGAESDKKNVMREIEVMKKLQHPKILQLHEVYISRGQTVG